jgi:hypothetical protein
MIVVSLTSWTKRIQYAKRVVESIMNNTVKPDRVYLNLSKTEFEGIDLPEDLVEYFNSDERLVLNWIEGENTKSMKKIFPILKNLNDDDFVIDGDDDKLFPVDLIESRLQDFEKYGKKFPVTSNNSFCGIGQARVISPLTLFQKKMLKNWEKFVESNVLHTYNDDRTYLYILFLNGYVAKPASKYSEKELNAHYDLHLDDTSMRTARIYPIGRNYDKTVAPTVLKLTRTTIDKAFNFFNTKRYDCVMPYGRVGVNSKIMTCGDHLEIEYVIASLKKYCSSWLGRIFIVGTEPPPQIKNDVIFVPCDNPYTHCKDANIIHKLRYACEHIPDLSNDFLMISDDQIVTKESSWSDMKPRIVRKYSDWSESLWEKNRKISSWQESLYQTMKLFPKDKAAFWEPHIWSPMNKKKFIDMCNKYDYQHNIACITQSLYYNYINQPIIRNFDHIHLLNNGKGTQTAEILDFNNLKRHLSWTDKPYENERFRNLLDMIVGFQEVKDLPKQSTRPKSLAQLRDDIANKKVVRVKVGNGYIWKRIK